jgi:hypothetical protein
MHFEIRLITIWKYITLAVLLSMTFMFSVIILFYGKFEWLGFIFAIPAVIGGMFLSVLLSTRTKYIEINDGVLKIDNSNPIQIDQIEWYNKETNFLLDTIRIRTIQKKNYYFSTKNFLNKDPNFKIFKDILINKTLDHPITEKTTHQLYVENKFLRHFATVAMILYSIIVLLTIFTDFKIDKIKLIYFGLIITGTFISTRK